MGAKQLLAGTGIASLALAVTGAPALAQTAPSTQIEELVVTAQRRSESAQSVPIAITAFSGDTLEKQSVRAAEDLAHLTPGLTFSRVGSGSGTPFLRGVGSNVASPGSEAAIATYVDNVYVGSQYASIFSLNNIASIEIDKGPQGTLFGRNATGGVIQITTRDPSHDAQGKVRVGYGNYDTVEGSLYVTGGVTDTIAADLAVYYRNQRDGWGTNVFNGDDVYVTRNTSVRSKWVWEPSDVTRATLILNYSTDYQQVGNARSVPAGQAFRPPGRTGNPGPYLNTNVGFYNVNLDFNSFARNEQKAVSTKFWHDFGAVEAVSITSYRKAKVHGPIDSDGSPVPWRGLDTNPWTTTFTQEVQLLSPSDGDSRLKWILGAFYYRDKATDNPVIFVGYGNSTTAPISLDAYQTTTSFSAFGQATYSLTDDTRLTVGLRHTADYRETEGSRFLMTNPPVRLTVTTQPGSTLPSARTARYSDPTWKFGVDHNFTPDFLAYATYSRGFKAGVFNTISLNTPPVAPEKIDAFEAGFKSDWLDNRLRVNVAAYYYDYRNLQVTQFVSGLYILNNAAKAEIKGVDFDITARPIADLQLAVSGTLLDPTYKDYRNGQGYVPVPITSVNPSGGMGGFIQTPTDLSGNQVIFTSKQTVNLSGAYTWRTSFGDIDASVVAQYRSRVYFDPQNGATQPSYTMVSGAVTWTSPERDWEVRVWGSNLTDEQIYATIARSTTGDLATPIAPRTFGVSVQKSF